MVEIKREELKVYNNSYPFLIYNRYDFTPSSGVSMPRLVFTYPLPNGMNFLLKSVRAKSNEYNFQAAKASPELYFEFFAAGESRTRQSNPVTAFHYCPNYMDSTNYGVIGNPNSKGKAIKSFTIEKTLNWFFSCGSSIRLDITGQTQYTNSYTLPMYLDVILMGEMIPASEFEKWGKK